MKLLIGSALVVGLLFQTGSVNGQEKFSTVKIYAPADREERAKLIGLLGIDHFQQPGDGSIISEISARDVARLRSTGYQYEILVDDIARNLEEVNRQYYLDKASGRLAFEQTGGTAGSIIPQPAAFVVQPTFGGYYSFAQMDAAMTALVSSYPSIAQKFSLGTTHEGRNIWCIKISDQVATDQPNEPEVLFIGLQHAREAIGGSSMIFFMQYLCEQYATDARVKDLVDNREIFIIPCMNPDGWEYNRLNGGAGSGWRKNRRDNPGSTFGVDLNRNWGWDWSNCSAPIVGNPTSCGSGDPADDTYYGPSAFSEPETQAIRDFTYTRQFVAMIDQHAYGPYYSLPFGRPSLPSNSMTSTDQKFYTDISSSMGTYNGMRSGNSPQALGYEVAGGVKDWMLKGNIGTGTKGKIYGLTGEGGAGGGTGGSYGSFWPPASQIVNLCKGMVFQNLQLLLSAGSYADIQDKTDISLDSRSGTFEFRLRRIGLQNQPVVVTLMPMENIISVGPPVTVNTLSNYNDTYNGGINYILHGSINAGRRVKFAWKIETGGITYYDTVTKFYNPIELFADDMEGSNVATNWTVTGGWNYATDESFSGSKSLAESPGGNYSASSTRRAQYNGTLDLGNATAAWISFWVKHRAENFYDKLQVEVSDDGGSTWTPIRGSTTVQEPGTLDGSTINGQPSLTGIREEWTRELFDLRDYLGENALRLRFDFTSGGATSYDFSEDDGFHIDDIRIIKSTASMIVLPVHFISFTGRLLPNNAVRLEWEAMTDQQHDYFEVERSEDGQAFYSIGKGPVSAPYWKTDAGPSIGNNYYRIKQVDKNGSITYSSTILIYYNPNRVLISTYPNPVKDVLSVKLQGTSADSYRILITDLSGRMVHDEKFVSNQAGAEMNIDLRDKSSQAYIIMVRNGRNELIATEKFVKQ